MKTRVSLKSRWDKDFENRLVKSRREREDFSNNTYRSGGRTYLADVAIFPMSKNAIKQLRIAAFRKFEDINGSIDDVGYLAQHRSNINEETHHSILTEYGIYKEEDGGWRSSWIEKANQIPLERLALSFQYSIYERLLGHDENDKTVNVDYYLAILNTFDPQFLPVFRVEIPYALKFDEEMLSAYHESMKMCRKIMSTIGASNMDTNAGRIKLRDAAETAALFMYVFWDDMTESERKYVVPAFILTNILFPYYSRKLQYDANLSNYSYLITFYAMVFENYSDEVIESLMITTEIDQVPLFIRSHLRIISGAYLGVNNSIQCAVETERSGSDPLFSVIASIHGSEVYDADEFGYTTEIIHGYLHRIDELAGFAKRHFRAETAIKWMDSGYTAKQADEFFDVGIKNPDEVEADTKLSAGWIDAWND